VTNFDAYLKKKRAMTGEVYTWSDMVTVNGLAGAEHRRVYQLVYP